MNQVEFYRQAKAFLLQTTGFPEAELPVYFKPNRNKPKAFADIFLALCESAQNRQMSPSVIGSAIGGVENMGKVLFGFNPKEVAEHYSKDEESQQRLFQKVESELKKPARELRNTPRSLWPQYCRTVIEGAHFLSRFESPEDFYRWADFFATDDRARPALPMLISAEVCGLGFPLACDFIKELGYDQYGKPDVHIKDVFRAFGLIGPESGNTTRQDIETLKVLQQIADANGIKSYVVDKIFWLIGSGYFYHHKEKRRGCKDAFIDQFAPKATIQVKAASLAPCPVPPAQP